MNVDLIKKQVTDWTIEGPTNVNRHSVISQGHYVGVTKPTETMPKILKGRSPKLLMDIHSVSEVNKTNIELSKLDRPAHSNDFK
jgi:NADH-quinone oxidoreductase subunit G